MTVHIRWTRGGEARIVSMGPAAILLRSTVPAPPGSRIEGTLEGPVPATLRLKVHSSRRQSEGDFLIEGRPVDLTREIRLELDALVRGSA